MATLQIQATGQAADVKKSLAVVAHDSLRFSVTEITASPGQAFHVQLQNKGTVPKAVMGHNWILLDSEAEASPYAMAAMAARAGDYQPKARASHALAPIPLLGPKAVGDATFNAPSRPGRYPYICSFPGHFQAGMHGELIVR